MDGPPLSRQTLTHLFTLNNSPTGVIAATEAHNELKKQILNKTTSKLTLEFEIQIRNSSNSH